MRLRSQREELGSSARGGYCCLTSVTPFEHKCTSWHSTRALCYVQSRCVTPERADWKHLFWYVTPTKGHTGSTLSHCYAIFALLRKTRKFFSMKLEPLQNPILYPCWMPPLQSANPWQLRILYFLLCRSVKRSFESSICTKWREKPSS